MIRVLSLVLTLSITVFGVEVPNIQTNQGSEINKKKEIDKSKQKRKTYEKATEKGSGRTYKSEKGLREAERKEFQKALELLNSKGITLEISIPSLVFSSLLKYYPDIFQKTVNDFYTVPISDGNFVNLTTLEYLNARAKAQSSVKEINTTEVLRYMTTLINVALQIKEQIPLYTGEILGQSDFEEISDFIARNIKPFLYERTPFKLSDKCILVGSYEKIKCGSCLLDLSQTKAMPELYCGGVPVFTQSNILGYTAKATANISYSLRDVESYIKGIETYQLISNTVEKYVKAMERKGVAVEKSLLKKLLIENAVKDSKTLNLALTKMQKEEDPSRIFGLLRGGR
jgi:hypothetical protein